MSHFFAILQIDGRDVQPHQLEHAATSLNRATTARYRARIWRDLQDQDTIGLIQLHQSDSRSTNSSTPTSSAAQQHVLIADLRLDNRTHLALELDRELAKDKPPSQTQSNPPNDHALLLAAYQRWGERCVDHLLGDFAFVLWDRPRRRLLCARDPIGNRSLFWFHDQRRLIISSTLTGFERIDGLNRQLDPIALAEHLAFTGNSSRTPYRDIHRLPAGHTLRYADGKLHHQRYWNPILTPLRLANDADYLQTFEQLLQKAVASRLPEHGDTGLLMSGGLDSSTVAATAAPLLDAQGKTLTAYSSLPPSGFRPPRGNATPLQEAPLIAAMAQLYPNIRRHTIQDQQINPLQDIERSFEFSQAPIVAAGNRSWLETALAHAADNGIAMMLNATFGNHTISYNGHTRLMDLLRRGRLPTLLGELRALAGSSGLSIRRLSINHLLMPLLPASAIHLLTRSGLSQRKSWQHYSPVSPTAAARHGPGPTLNTPHWNRHNASAQWRLNLFNDPLLQDALDNVNAWRHQYGIEISDPTGDQRLVEFCLRLPDEQFLRNGQDRSLIRRAMQGKLPTELINQTRKAEQAQDWFIKMAPMREEFCQELQRMRHSETAREVLDLDRLEALVEDWPDSDQPGWAGWAGEDTATNYKFVLQRGIAAGRFIRWVESRES